MHKLLLAGVALVTLSVASPVLAQSNDGATAAGATAGATTGGTLAYVHIGDRPALVDTRTRTVIWVQ